jgi:hypothetical protein
LLGGGNGEVKGKRSFPPSSLLADDSNDVHRTAMSYAHMHVFTLYFVKECRRGIESQLMSRHMTRK